MVLRFAAPNTNQFFPGGKNHLFWFFAFKQENFSFLYISLLQFCLILTPVVFIAVLPVWDNAAISVTQAQVGVPLLHYTATVTLNHDW